METKTNVISIKSSLINRCNEIKLKEHEYQYPRKVFSVLK